MAATHATCSFQSAPLTEARGDFGACISSRWAIICFNPLPSPKQGETFVTEYLFRTNRVSIRSPHRSKGRHLGDLFVVQGKLVSIRSPHRSKGRLVTTQWTDSAGMFQSAPLTEARGDPPSRCGIHETDCFNPLPSPKQGETSPVANSSFLRCCFNPLPSPKQGETPCATPSRSFRYVSIRSPHRSKGRPFRTAALSVSEWFQSAPLTEARGDRSPRARLLSRRSFNPLPSPKQGETPIPSIVWCLL